MDDAEALLELLQPTPTPPQSAVAAAPSVVSFGGSLNATPTAVRPTSTAGGLPSSSSIGGFAVPTSSEAVKAQQEADAAVQRSQRVIQESKTAIRISRPTAACEQLNIIQGQFPHVALPLYAKSIPPPSNGSVGSSAAVEKSTIGVVVARYDPKQSTGKGGGQYATVKLWDMKGFCTQSAVRLLLSGMAFREHYTNIDVGSVVCLVRAAVLPPKAEQQPPSTTTPNTEGPLLHVTELDQLKRLGYAVDFGYCQAMTESTGQQCRNVVHKETPYCASHMTALRASVKKSVPSPTPQVGNKSQLTLSSLNGKVPVPMSQRPLTAAGGSQPTGDLLCVRSKRVVTAQGTPVSTATAPLHTAPLDLRIGGGPQLVTGVDLTAGKGGPTIAALGVSGRGKAVLDAAIRQSQMSKDERAVRDVLKRPREPLLATVPPTVEEAPRLLNFAPLEGHGNPLLANVVLRQPTRAAHGVVADAVRRGGVSTSPLTSTVRSSSSNSLLQLAASMGSRNDDLRELSERDRLAKSGEALLKADRVVSALETVHEKKVRAVHCVQCNRWSYQRRQDCVLGGHTMRSGEVMQRYMQCDHCHERVAVLGETDAALLVPRCPRCKRQASWSKGSAAPTSLKSLRELQSEES